jgi:hypothetical protein
MVWGNKATPSGVVSSSESDRPPGSLSFLSRRTGCWWSDNRRCPVIEIMLISLAVVAGVVVLAGVVGRLGELDDVSTMRDMVDRS